MKCDKCGNEATVHEVTIRSGKKVERHLCETCAKGEGLPVQSSHASLAQVISQHIAQQAAAASQHPTTPTEVAKATQCPTCGTTYAQFRHDGLLGCADCYATFEVQLGPLLERAHEGGTHHVGKIPRRVSAPPLGLPQGRMARPVAEPVPAASAREEAEKERKRRAEVLRRRLAEAVAAEQYETAAKLRDELRQLGEPTGAAQAAAAAPKKAAGKDAGPGPGGSGGGGGGGGGGAGGGK